MSYILDHVGLRVLMFANVCLFTLSTKYNIYERIPQVNLKSEIRRNSSASICTNV